MNSSASSTNPSTNPSTQPVVSIKAKLVYGVADPHGFSLNVDTQIPATGITAIFGKSGSGKTTLLRCLAGLEQPKDAELSLGDDIWQDKNQHIATHLRDIGYVFQEASLFSHLSVQGNLQYGGKRQQQTLSPTRRERIIEILELGQLMHRYPDQLSGGERQRVAIARTLFTQPRLLLMDEPLASLDFARRQQILAYIKLLHHETQTPIVYVTHALDEVVQLADHVIMLEAGTVAAQGSVTEVFARTDLPLPGDQELGAIITGTIVEQDNQWQLSKVALHSRQALSGQASSAQGLWVRTSETKLGDVIRVRALARDISIALTHREDSSILNCLQAEIAHLEEDSDPAFCIVHLNLEGVQLMARLTQKSAHHLALEAGQQVWAQIKSVAVLS